MSFSHASLPIRRIELLLCRGWAQQIADRWYDAVSPGSPPSASDDLDLHPCDVSLEKKTFSFIIYYLFTLIAIE